MRKASALLFAAAMQGSMASAMTALSDRVPLATENGPTTNIRHGNNRYHQSAEIKHKRAKIAAKSRRRNRR